MFEIPLVADGPITNEQPAIGMADVVQDKQVVNGQERENGIHEFERKMVQHSRSSEGNGNLRF